MFVTDIFFVKVCLLEILCEGMFVTVSLSRYVSYRFSVKVCLLQILFGGMFVTDSL